MKTKPHFNRRPALRFNLRLNVHGMRWKLMLPYTGLTIIFALAAGYGFTRMLTSSLEDRLNSQLNEARAVASDVAVRDERQHLATLRSIGFTDGVSQAVEDGDSATLDSLVRPVVVNAKAERVEVIDRSGQRLFGSQLSDPKTLRYEPLTDSPQYSSWSIVTDALAGRHDALGDKWSQLVSTESGLILYTAGPILDLSGRVIGAVLVGNRADSFLSSVKAAAQADVTLYDLSGHPLTSTFVVGADDPSALAPSAATTRVVTVSNKGTTERKSIAGRDYEFLFSDLRVRNEIIARFGVALPTASLADAGRQAQWQTSIVFGLLAVAVLFVGWVLARGLTQPLRRLVRTALAVASGDLSARTELHGRDEIAMVAATFDAMTTRLERQHVATIGALASAIDARDPYTAGHSVRVGELSVELGREIGLPSSSLYQLRIGGILHDIGKIGVRDSVLLKPGALTEEERKLIQEHPRIGLNILAEADLPPEVMAIVGGHHERLNGAGYPLGLNSEQLTIFPRIASVADVYDALTSDRPYRAGMTVADALRILQKEALEGLVDPDVVAAMTKIAREWELHLRSAGEDAANIRELLRRPSAA